MAMVPFQVHANTAQTALEACADALASELSLSNGSDVSYRLDSDNEGFDRKMQSLERISLYARDPSKQRVGIENGLCRQQQGPDHQADQYASGRC